MKEAAPQLINSPVGGPAKQWRLLALSIDPIAEEFAANTLFESGAQGTVVLYETRDEIRLGGYFSEKVDVESLEREIEDEFVRCGQRECLRGMTASTVAEEDWMQKWKEGFEPIEIGSRLLVTPSWKSSQVAGRAVVQIDPGMAFGTGSHETTRLCLEAIEKYWRGGSLLDVGTGTGILAIAAALLSPGSRIFAIDIDPQAVEVARENAAINAVGGSIQISESQPASFAGQAFSFVVANLTAEVICDLIQDLTRCMAATGVLVLSGILAELAEEVEKAAEEAGLMLVERKDAGEWSGLVMRMR